MTGSNIKQVLSILDEIIANKNNDSVTDLGGYIVGQLTLRDDIDELYAKYPQLEFIGQNAWSLEVLENSDPKATELYTEILDEINKLKLYININGIFNRLVGIMSNSHNESLDKLGSYIVGCTIVLDDIDEYYKDYPVLEEVAELGAELETVSDRQYQIELLDKIKAKLVLLKDLLDSKQS